MVVLLILIFAIIIYRKNIRHMIHYMLTVTQRVDPIKQRDQGQKSDQANASHQNYIK